MQRTVQNAVTHNEGDTVWNSFMRCRLLNYFVHGRCIITDLVIDVPLSVNDVGMIIKSNQ